MILTAENLTVRYGSHRVLDGVSFTLAPGQWLMLAGPNGAGKSTALLALAQSAPYTGRVLLDGADAAHMKPRLLAKSLGMLEQSHFVGDAFTVEEIVAMGRYAYRSGPFSRREPGDAASVERALDQTGLTGLRRRLVTTLSGGEVQRTFLAQLLAQDPKILLLDEPAAALDLYYQREMFALVRDWMNQTGGSVLSVVHDLSLALAYGTHALLLNRGKIVSSGVVAEALSREKLAEVYGLDVYDYMEGMLSLWRKET